MLFDKLDYNYKIQDNNLIEGVRFLKTINSDNGIPLIRININIPKSKNGAFLCNREIFDSCFNEIKNEFFRFIEISLKKNAEKNIDNNHPYSAVMKYILTYYDDDYISIILDSFIYTEKGRSKTKRMAFNFSRINCEQIISEDIFKRCDLIKYISLNGTNKKLRKYILKSYDLSDFYFTPNGVLFFYEMNSEFCTFIVNKNDI